MLAHVSTRAQVVVFLTHAGMNGVGEGTASGTPMLCLPLFSDQPDNCRRMVDRGMALRVTREELMEVTGPERLQQALRQLSAGGSFADAVARARALNDAAGGVALASHIVETTAVLGYTGASRRLRNTPPG